MYRQLFLLRLRALTFRQPPQVTRALSVSVTNIQTHNFRSITTLCGNQRASDFKGPSQVAWSTGSPGGRRQDNPITQMLVSAKTPEDVLILLEMNSDQMDTLTLCVAQDALFDILKAGPPLPTKAKHQLLTSVGMQKLCKSLRRLSPHMDPGDIINSVKLLSFLSAPGSHQTLQILLKILSKHANLMDLHQLVYTQFLLDKLDQSSKSPLSKALEFALPVVFESKLQSDLDPSDASAICDYLHYSSKYKLSEKTINFLVAAALKVTDRLSSPHYAKSIIWSLCDIKFESPEHVPLVEWAFRKLTDSIDSHRLDDLVTTISKVAKKYSRWAPHFYNADFVDAFCSRVTQPDVNPLVTLWSIKNVSICRHLNIDFIDRVGDIIASNPTYILNDDNLFSFFVKSISNFNYKPEKWQTFSSILLEHPALDKSYGLHDVTLAMDFIALDMFPEKMINTLFSYESIELLEQFQRKLHPVSLVILLNAVKILYPNYSGPMPPLSLIETWKELSRASWANKSYPLKTALQAGLGGESYVINGVYHEGLHIDHGIVMRKGGYPVAVNSQIDSQSDCLNNIPKPAESAIVLIKVLTGDFYANNTRRLRGPYALELKILESLGHPVVGVDLEAWTELPDHEKIPYLMQKIREKMEPLQWNKNWGDVIPP